MEASAKNRHYDGESTRRLLNRFSSIHLEFDNERRQTVSSHQQHDVQVVLASSVHDKQEIQKRLRASVEKYNLPELYVQMILALFPQIKSQEMPDSNALIQYLKKVFRFSDEQHANLMEKAKLTKLPQRIINLEVVKARDIPAMDVNGFADPFCVVYVNTLDIAQRTKHIPETLEPVWRQYFTFKIADTYSDVLYVDVMDYNEQDESFKDRIKRIKEVKSSKKLGSFIKGVANTRQVQEKIGTLKIPVAEISSETVERWYKLKNRENKGEIYLRMALGYNKSIEAATEEFFKIVHLLVAFELDKDSALNKPYHWHEEFEIMWSKYILRQFKWQGGLKPKDIVLAKYRAYVTINAIFPLNPDMLSRLLDAVLKRITNKEFNASEMSKFWRNTVTLVDSVTDFILNIHDVLPCSETIANTPDMLKITELLCNYLQEQSSSEKENTQLTKSKLFVSIHEALRDGANKFFQKVLSESKRTEQDDNIYIYDDLMQVELEQLLKLGQLLHEDIRLGIERVTKDFKEILNVDYLTIVFQVYDEQYGKLVKELVEEYNCRLMNTIKAQSNDDENMDENSPFVKTGLDVLKLYLTVKHLASFAPSNYLDVTNSKSSLKRELHNWFFPSVASWIHTLRRRVKDLIKTSVAFSETDKQNFKPDDLLSKENKHGEKCENVPISATAVNTAQLFSEINKFWTSLNWEEPSQSYIIAIQILEELYGVLYYYAYQLLLAQKAQNKFVENQFDIPKIQFTLQMSCVEMNNINYVKDHVEVLAEQLNIPQIIYQIELCSLDNNSNYEESVSKMKTGMLDEYYKLFHMITENCVQSVLPKLQQLLLEVTKPELWRPGSCRKSILIVEPVLQFIDKCLMTMRNNLENQSFLLMLSELWKMIVGQIDAQVSLGLDTRKTAEYFQCLKSLMDHLHSLFWPDEVKLEMTLKFPSLFEGYEKVKQKLWTLGAPLEELKFQYYSNRFKRQQATPTTTNQHGTVTIRVGFAESASTIVVEMLNGSKLKSYDNNNLSDPYANVTLVPSELFAGSSTHTTKVHYKTLYPMFEETFEFSISDEDRKNGFLHIELYDYDFIGNDDFMGEVFFPLSEFAVISSTNDTDSFIRLALAVGKPDVSDLEFLKMFEERLWDKEAQQFAKREKSRAS